MYLFKYYRPDFFFDKAIRYNELYFSSTEQLNDPNDLKTSYFFEDRVDLWQRLLESEVSLGVKNLKDFLDLDGDRLAKKLCQIFLGSSIDGSIEELQSLFTKYNSKVATAISLHIKKSDLIDHGLFEDSEESISRLVSLCSNEIRERVLKGLRVGVYSVSFSINALEPMMWAHYSAGFKGCVVIYHAPKNIIPLKRNIYSDEYINYPIDSVEYRNHEKHIPILQSVLTDDLAIRKTLLVKNKFWNYEKEKRIFLTKRYLTQSLGRFNFALSNDNSDRIYHHAPSLISGVIFGPNFDKQKKESIELLLRDNRRHTPCDPFYLFDTELTSSGNIKIVRCKEVESSFNTGNTGEISIKETQEVLIKFGIINT
ncbi:DUF2971 domain-containing protein [Serratia ureilytica]|uniref:DUF2971 domain-containing protein n=1 Tax=Serratia ureilytica TaxID=300181 RepID=UPI0018A74B25|nr:DUF2971 domain-containing protein [Serratia ureilytica]MBF8442339.1 DUF2971 domain-containing protein [Serratia ureilytica]MBF8446063.1 DUF2971 domain-containing protein [Serratia ureilytica]